jgi:hypothetical protein
MNVKMKFYFVEGEEKKVNIIKPPLYHEQCEAWMDFLLEAGKQSFACKNLFHAHLSRICTIL